MISLRQGKIMRVAQVEWEFVQGFVEPVVWVASREFDLLWQKSDDYIGVAGAGSPYGDYRYKNVGIFIRKHRRLWYPVVSLEDGVLAFTDGRHRTAWLRDHGAETIAVACSEEDALVLEQLCGTDRRQTFFRLPWFAACA